jgi:hypothetical protein
MARKCPQKPPLTMRQAPQPQLALRQTNFAGYSIGPVLFSPRPRDRTVRLQALIKAKTLTLDIACHQLGELLLEAVWSEQSVLGARLRCPLGSSTSKVLPRTADVGGARSVQQPVQRVDLLFCNRCQRLLRFLIFFGSLPSANSRHRAFPALHLSRSAVRTSATWSAPVESCRRGVALSRYILRIGVADRCSPRARAQRSARRHRA